MDLEDNTDCQSDYLAIHQGRNIRGKLLTRVCGMIYPESVTSKGRDMFLRFVSDHAVGGFGFRLHYEIHDPIRKCVVIFTLSVNVYLL